MSVVVTHTTPATTPNNPAKEISSDAWNEEHALSGLGTAAEANTEDFDAAGTAASAITTHEAAVNPHPGYLTPAEGGAAYDAIGAAAAAVAAHEADTTNVHDHGSLSGNADNDHPQYLLVTDIDDAPVNGELAQPISSNWAFDHVAAADPHPGYLTTAEGDAAYAALSHGTHVPVGGTTGQVLKKASNDDGDVAWDTDETSAGGGVDTANSPNANEFARFTDADTIEGRTASEARTDLGLVIGTNVQAHSAVLDATTASFTSADETKLDGIAAGATAGATWGSNITSQPAVVTQADAEAGTATAEKIWTAQRVAQAIAALGGGGGFTSIAIKTVEASGDYTPTSGMQYCICILTGSGGGGGGADSSTTTNDIGVGGGGGAGTTRLGFFTAADIGASKAVVLNAGGTAGSATNGTTGGTPSDNTFGSTLLVAPGGLGGVGSGVATEALNAQLGGAGGGAGSGGVFGVEGGGGGAAFAHTVDGTVGDGSLGIGGAGGSSFWGGGGLGGALFSVTIGASATSAGTAGKAPGSGGGGAVCSDTAAGAAGGAGKIGIFVAIEFI